MSISSSSSTSTSASRTAISDGAVSTVSSSSGSSIPSSKSSCIYAFLFGEIDQGVSLTSKAPCVKQSHARERSTCGPREESESSSAAARASGGGAPRAVINDGQERQ